MSENLIACTPKRLPVSLHVQAAAVAIAENPANQVFPAAQIAPLPPGHLALLTGKYWGARGVKLGVQFLDVKSAALKRKILAHMNLWNKGGKVNVKFRESKRGEVRLATTPGEGYWSYIGTDILSIPEDQPTMNLDSFSLQTPDSEYLRVVCHEAGHTLGFPHEHARPEIVALLDPEKTIRYFYDHYTWSPEETRQQVLDPLDPDDLMATPLADQVSIMAYQFPGDCTRSGEPIPGGQKIDAADYDFAATLYPTIERKKT